MKSFMKHPLVVTIIGTVLGTVIATYIVSSINSISIINALKTIYYYIINLIITVLTFNIPVYIILILIILFMLILKVIIRINHNEEDSFLNYKEDVIEGGRWKWDWIKIYGRYSFVGKSPIPLCNHCKGNLVYGVRGYKDYLYCENCGYEKEMPHNYDFNDYQDKTKREIHRRIRVNYDSE